MTTRRMIKGTSKPTYVSVNRGLALLDEAIEQIELQTKRKNGGEWNQDAWRCESGMCLAGWVAQLAGGEWAFPASNEDYAECLVANDDDNPEAVYTIAEGTKVIDARDRAEELLEIDDYTADSLFGANNDLTKIRRLRNELAAEGTIGD